MYPRFFLVLASACAGWAVEPPPLSPTDPRRDNPRYANAPADATESYPETANATRAPDPEGDAALERRARVQTLLEALVGSGSADLALADQDLLLSLLGVDLLLLPEQAGQPFRHLCVAALDGLAVEGWWHRPNDRRLVSAILDVVTQAHVAVGSAFFEPFAGVGAFESSAIRILAQLQAIIPDVPTFAELDAVEHAARNAYAILATTGRAPASTFQELSLYAALVRRRAALRP